MFSYSNYFVISKENEENFTKDKKTNLSTLEKVGLETILDDFVKDYEDTVFGESHSIKDYIRYNDDNVDILDGVTDTYIFDNYAIGEVWTTTGGCILMTVADLDTAGEKDEDIFEKPSKYDIWSEAETRLIRLD